MFVRFLKYKIIPFFLVMMFIGSACQAQPDAVVDDSRPATKTTTTLSAVVSPSLTPSLTATIRPSETPLPSPTASATSVVTPTADLRLLPADWRNWPIIPSLSPSAYQLYQSGLASGNDATRFSVIGDCQSVPEVFLGVYETDWYWLGEEYQYLQETIDAYLGSFSHESLAVKGGMSTSTALSPLWADQEKCNNNESPVACELRDYHPSIVFINLGTNWRADASTVPYEEYLRQIVDIVVAHGTLPILLTKADNIEGDESINLITAKVAYDYDVPMVNFWLAAQFLKNNGLDESTDNIYLTPTGWDRRNFVALEALDAIHRQIGVYGGGE